MQLTDEQKWAHVETCSQFFSDTVNKRLLCNGLSQAMKHGCTTMNLLSKCQSMGWKHVTAQDQEIQKCAFCWKSDVDTVLRLHWAHSLGLPGSWTDGQ
jgi:hypothetical protein